MLTIILEKCLNEKDPSQPTLVSGLRKEIKAPLSRYRFGDELAAAKDRATGQREQPRPSCGR